MKQNVKYLIGVCAPTPPHVSMRGGLYLNLTLVD